MRPFDELIYKTGPFNSPDELIVIHHPFDLRDKKTYKYARGSITRTLDHREYESFMHNSITLISYED